MGFGVLGSRSLHVAQAVVLEPIGVSINVAQKPLTAGTPNEPLGIGEP